ncbi:hypothetical protein [Polaribacter aestuariivivens]|uniref:hypothetical protein n=1 Tax=Polaribacter aestuariivivens TaxID=2304626 RepID=UPI003F4962BD
MKKYINKEKLFLFINKTRAIDRRFKITTRIWLIFLSVSLFLLREENSSIKLELSEAKIKIASFEKENLTLKTKVAFFNNGFRFFPLAIWKKKKAGNQYIGSYFNPPYVSIFGHLFDYDATNLIGKNNFELGYPLKTAIRFRKNDSVIAHTGIPQILPEDYIDSIGRFRDIDVLKWRELREVDTLINGTVLKFYPPKKQ